MDLETPARPVSVPISYMYDILCGCPSKQVKLAVITLTIVPVAKPLCMYDKIIAHGIHSNGTHEV